MIKTNVILDNKKWKKYIKNPSIYLKNKINDDKKLLKIKTLIEYLIICLIVYYIFF